MSRGLGDVYKRQRLYDGVETARLFTAASSGDNSLLLLISEGPQALTAAESKACADICAAIPMEERCRMN